MRTYLQSLNWGSTLFALVAVAITTTVILTDLEHRTYRQLTEASPAIQTAKAQPLNALGRACGPPKSAQRTSVLQAFLTPTSH